MITWLKKYEEKIVFLVSTYFWHIIGVIALISSSIGIIIFLYSIIPASKPNIEKPAYPKANPVTKEDILNKMYPGTSHSQSADKPAETANDLILESLKSKKEAEKYVQSLEKLKGLLPQDKYPWTSYTYYKNKYYYYGIFDMLNNAFDRLELKSYEEKAEVVDSLCVFVKLCMNKYYEDMSMEAFVQAIDYRGKNLIEFRENVSLLIRLGGTFTNSFEPISILGNFGERNPKDGAILINYILNNISKFDNSEYVNAIKVITEYYYRLGENVEQLILLTDGYYPLMHNFDKNERARSLEYYYLAANDKNINLRQAINSINQQYQNEVSNAEQAYLETKAKKQVWLSKSIVAVAGGLFLLAFIGILLAILSLQRYIKTIEQRLEIKEPA